MKRQKPTETTLVCAAVSPKLSPAQSTTVRNADSNALRAARAPRPRRGTFVRAIKECPGSVWLASISALLLLSSPPLAGNVVGGRTINLFLTANLLLPAIVVGWTAYADHRRNHILARIPRGYILREELTRDAATLLTRAQEAAHAILHSTALTHNAIDQQRTRRFLSREIWQIACVLAHHSAQQADNPRLNITPQTTLPIIERRVARLEERAATAAAAHDDRHGPRRPDSAPFSDDGDVLGLPADTTRDEYATDHHH